MPLLSLALFVLSVVGWAVAQSDEKGKITVFIDKDRNAVVQTEDHGTGKSAPNGNGLLGMDLQSGLSTFKLSVDTKGEVKGGNLSLYSEVNSTGTVGLADFNFMLPPEAKIKLNADGKYAQTDKAGSHLEGKFDLEMPNPKPIPLEKFSLDGSTKGDYKSGTTKFSFNVTSAALQQSPVKTFKLTINETPGKDNAGPTTTIALVASGDAKGVIGQAIQQLGGKEGIQKQIEGGLSAAKKLKAESVTVNKAEVSGEKAEIDLSLKLTGLRDEMAGWAEMLTMRSGAIDANTMKGALDTMFKVQVNKLEIDATIDGGAITGKVDTEMGNLDKFFEGYLTLVSAFQQAMQQQMAQRGGEKDKAQELAMKWAQAIQKKSNELNRVMFAALANGGAKNEATFKIDVDLKDQSLIKAKGEVKQDMTNIDKAMAEIRQKGFAVPEKGGLMFKVAGDGGKLTGNLFLESQGNMWDLLKAYLVEPAKAEADLKETAELLSSIKLEDSRTRGELKDGKVELEGYAKTSDLTAAATALQKVMAPDLAGVPVGVRIESSSDQGKSKNTLRVGFKQFMPGKSDEDVETTFEKVFRADDEVEVKGNAEAAQVALSPKLEQPKIDMPASLATLKTQAETALFPAGGIAGPLSGGSSTTGGLNTTAIAAIAGGVVLLLVILMAATRKKS